MSKHTNDPNDPNPKPGTHGGQPDPNNPGGTKDNPKSGYDPQRDPNPNDTLAVNQGDPRTGQHLGQPPKGQSENVQRAIKMLRAGADKGGMPSGEVQEVLRILEGK